MTEREMHNGLHRMFGRLAHEPAETHDSIIRQAWDRYCSRDGRSIREICEDNPALIRRLADFWYEACTIGYSCRRSLPYHIFRLIRGDNQEPRNESNQPDRARPNSQPTGP
jgi:hypothetical protein